ncbi:MAG: ATP-dependent DNA ligase [Streptosporangiaceae bacterium]|nr:ATP-dependent DNA ligase [Streptosporangiaceae bacterium]
MARGGRPDTAPSSGKLTSYQRKRDFARTPEPAGAPEPDSASAGGGAARFVVQLHRARRPHYDVRFEIGGVLVSWAVPKGPTLDPGIKRVAVHVEDHPIEYLDFEGVIPSGQYGGGDVIVWDRGTWEPHGTDDAAAAVAAGELHADVRGHKLRGRLVLVRRGRDRSGKDEWLLLHKRDQYAVQGWEPADYPRSVLSGRTNDEVKADPRRMWRSDLPPAQASVAIDGAVAGGPGQSSAVAGGPGQSSTVAGGPGQSSTVAGGPGQSSTVAGPSDDELEALDSLESGGSWEVFGRRLRLTNLDKVLFPPADGQPPVTKREFIRYAACMAAVVLPYLTGRALNMHRFPNGADTPGFWHKQLPDHAPKWISRWDNPDADPGESSTYLVVNEPATLVWVANFGALEWHAWTSCTDQPRLPTYALIDIDPGTATSWEDVLVLARLHCIALQHLGVASQPKLTGRRGIQIWIPIARGPSFDDTRSWTEQLSRAVGAAVPELVSWEWNVRDRGGLARLDYTQNVINKTLVAPYSPRAAAGAPVSAPIDWDELDEPSLRPSSFTIRDFPRRLAERGDMFRTVLTAHQTLPPIT